MARSAWLICPVSTNFNHTNEVQYENSCAGRNWRRCHAVGNKILEHAFTEAGYKVVNLGVMVSQDEFIKAAIETNADAIMVSSLYGQGELDCQGMREKCIEAGIGDIPLFCGGNLVVGKHDFAETEKIFKDMGFNYVYAPGTMPDVTIADLRKELGE